MIRRAITMPALCAPICRSPFDVAERTPARLCNESRCGLGQSGGCSFLPQIACWKAIFLGPSQCRRTLTEATDPRPIPSQASSCDATLRLRFSVFLADGSLAFDFPGDLRPWHTFVASAGRSRVKLKKAACRRATLPIAKQSWICRRFCMLGGLWGWAAGGFRFPGVSGGWLSEWFRVWHR